MNVLIPLGAVVGLLAFGASASAKTKTSAKTGGPGQPKASELPGANQLPPAPFVAEIDAARASADPNVMRQVAAKMESFGFAAQGADLRAAATEVERVLAGAGAVRPPAPAQPSIPGPVFASTSPGQPTGRPSPSVTLPPVPLPVFQTVQSPLPGGGTVPMSAAPADHGQVLAGKVALNIRTSQRGKENRELVKQFQLAEQQRGNATVGVADGLYGPKTAIAIAKRGVVPPKPLYWSNVAATARVQRKEYAEAMLMFANTDTIRGEEWRQAAKV